MSTSVFTYCQAVQKRKALNLPTQTLEVKQPKITLSKQSKEKVVADYAATYVTKAQETGKKTYDYPYASALYKSCVMKPRLTA